MKHMIKIFEEYTRHYKYFTEKEKTDFDNSVLVPEDTPGNWEEIYYDRELGKYDRIMWDKRKKIKRKLNMEEYYSIHGYGD
jgi:hypothetical protein